jgi:hypothetical protein
VQAQLRDPASLLNRIQRLIRILRDVPPDSLHDLTGDRLYPPSGQTIELAPFGYRWLRLGQFR